MLVCTLAVAGWGHSALVVDRGMRLFGEFDDRSKISACGAPFDPSITRHDP